MEHHIHNPQPFRYFMASQNFHWDDQWVLDQIIVHAGMKDVDSAIVRGTRHQWIGCMVMHSTETSVVVLQSFVRSVGQV